MFSFMSNISFKGDTLNRYNNNNNFVFIYNLTHSRMFTGEVRTDGSRLLQELNLAVRQPRRAPHHAIQATMSEGLAQGG